MSEEEIIKNLKDFIEAAQEEKNFIYYSQYKYENEIADYIKDLLDLYNKEKEKNNYARLEKEALLESCISKDKIREKIKEYIEKSKQPLVNSQSRREYTFRFKSFTRIIGGINNEDT